LAVAVRGRDRLASPADLARHTLLHQIGFREGWIHWLARAGASGQVDANKGVEFDTAVLAIEQAVRGKGVALGRTCYVEELVAEGRLAVPFDIVLASTEAFYLVSPEGRRDNEAARLFRAWLLAEAGRKAGRHG
jgi:LysR family glycine cleavage system transcriptional activator